jgi:hypothetical protein
MCPVCITTTVALVAAGAGSTGGLTALIARMLHRKRAAAAVAMQSKPEPRDGSTVAPQVKVPQQGAIK